MAVEPVAAAWMPMLLAVPFRLIAAVGLVMRTSLTRVSRFDAELPATVSVQTPFVQEMEIPDPGISVSVVIATM